MGGVNGSEVGRLTYDVANRVLEDEEELRYLHRA